MPARLQKTAPVTDRAQLLCTIPRVFEQAAASVANHRKNHVALYKIHTELAEYTEELNKGKHVKLTGEREFEDKFQFMFMRVTPLKKGEPSGDRIVKFVGGYTKFINEKAAEEKSIDDGDDEDDTTIASRFTSHLLKLLLKGFLAKDKNIRYRVLQTVAEMISHLGEIDEDMYIALRAALIDRVYDKEWTVRYQVVISLAKLCVSEDSGELDEEDSILDILLETLAYDASPDVRRSILHNIPISHQTLPAILNRTRDTDTTTRKFVYSVVLDGNTTEKPEGDRKIIGPTHPRALTVAQRELIVRNGLGDRESAVRAAAGSLMATWVDVVAMKVEDMDVPIDNAGDEELESGILTFLTLFDLSEGTIAVDALLSVFLARVDIFNNIEFDDQYWRNLTPEKAFLARVFVDHCKDIKDDVRLEATLPVVTAIAFRIQESYNLLLDDQDLILISDNDGEAESTKREDERMAREFVMSELLKLAVNLDYSDEIGRRKMFQLVRDMLRRESLPESLMAPCLDVLRILSSNERDLILLVVETVQELRDGVYGDEEEEAEESAKDADPETSFEQTPVKPRPVRKPVEDMSPEQRAHVDRVDLRCLSLCIGMLERVNSTFEENITLDGVLRELIIPSVQRKEVVFRESGLKSLGLCCLIARRLALQSINLFMNQIPSSQTSIKITLVKSLFDIFMVHENAMFKNQENNLEALTTFLLSHIAKEQDPEVQAILCEGTSKLVLSGMITDVNVVKNLLKTYLSPLTMDNQNLRQCLAFFLQMYSYSSPMNQKCMREIFIHIFLDICQDRKEARNSDDDVVISSAQVAAMFVDWTDPLRLSHAIHARGTQDTKAADECVQLDMAEDVLRTLFENDLKVNIEKEDKRVLCQLLNKLYVPDAVDDYRIRSLKLLIDNLRTRRPLRDSVCNTAFTKFETTISKKFEKQLEHFSEEEFRKFEELNDLFQFLDSIIPLDDDEFIDIDAPRKGRKRRSESIATTTTEGDSRAGSPSGKGKGKAKAKRARLSTSDGDDGDDDQSTKRGSQPPPAVPTRALPKRAAAAKKHVQVVVISSDSEDYGEATPGPARKGKSGAQIRSSVKEEEAQVDEDADALLTHDPNSTLSETPFDSIIDPDSEEEEEVNDLLAED